MSQQSILAISRTAFIVSEVRRHMPCKMTAGHTLASIVTDMLLLLDALSAFDEICDDGIIIEDFVAARTIFYRLLDAGLQFAPGFIDAMRDLSLQIINTDDDADEDRDDPDEDNDTSDWEHDGRDEPEIEYTEDDVDWPSDNLAPIYTDAKVERQTHSHYLSTASAQEKKLDAWMLRRERRPARDRPPRPRFTPTVFTEIRFS